MLEQRTFARYSHGADSRASVECTGLKEDAAVIDVGAGGMRIMLTQARALGDNILGKLKIVNGIGPFYVQGKVVRVLAKDGLWETAVKFDKVSTLPLLQEMPRVA